jgi:ribosomal protein S18 acetylase RimI-like enzyme
MSTMLGIDLRSGAVADLAIVDRIMQAAFDARFGEAWTHNQVLGLLAMPGVWLTIAEVGGEPAGFALCRRVLEEAELLLLATAPHLRRRGVAAALLGRSTWKCATATKRSSSIATKALQKSANVEITIGDLTVACSML